MAIYRTEDEIKTYLRRFTKADRIALAQGCYVDTKYPNKVRKFFKNFLVHTKGSAFAGKPFEPLEWQWEDLIKPLFGWRDIKGHRRFRTVYLEVPKKNGKSTISAGFALYLLIADNEPGAEVYSVAGEKEQAAIVYNEAIALADNSPEISNRVIAVPSNKRLDFPETRSFYRVLSSDASTKEGYNVHGLVFDEYHVQKNTDLRDVLEFAGASREQPLQIIITTAGNDKTSPCWHEHNYALSQMDDGLDEENCNIRYLGIIYTVSDPEKWEDEAEWYKANPSLGKSLAIETFRDDFKKSKGNNRLEPIFKRYRLNIWTETETKWFDSADWDACLDTSVIPEMQEECYAGLDLATSQDTNSLALFFPKSRLFLYWFWVPEHQIMMRRGSTKYRYDGFVKAGHLQTCEGRIMKYENIFDKLVELRQDYNIVEVGCDPYNATQLCGDLASTGFNVVYYSQRFSTLSNPSKLFHDWMVENKLKHHGNSMMRWMIRNVAKAEDKQGNIMPDKVKSGDKIDGVASSIIALGLYIKANEDGRTSFPYNNRGIREV